MEILDKLVTRGKPGEAFLEPEVKSVLKEMGVPIPAGTYIPAGHGIPQQLALSFPLVAKIAAPAIASKTDVGGVRLGIRDEAQLAEAVKELQEIPGTHGILIEEMVHPGVEVIVGGVVDPQFGPIVMFGLGGLFVELFRDVAFAMAPLDEPAARRLVAGTKGARVLQGYRGRPPVDMDFLSTVLVTVSQLMASGLIEEIDLNPVILYPKGGIVVDAKMKRLKP